MISIKSFLGKMGCEDGGGSGYDPMMVLVICSVELLVLLPEYELIFKRLELLCTYREQMWKWKFLFQKIRL
jgi:hypothetical protein